LTTTIGSFIASKATRYPRRGDGFSTTEKTKTRYGKSDVFPVATASSRELRESDASASLARSVVRPVSETGRVALD